MKFKAKPELSIKIFDKYNRINLDKLKYLKNNGVEFDKTFLQKICNYKECYKIHHNAMIKYLIEECKIKTNEECIKSYSKELATYLLLLNKYNKNNISVEKNKKYILNKKLIKRIKKNNVEINNDQEYIINDEIKNLIEYNQNTIKYYDLKEKVTNNLISNKLCIDNYFLINNDLENIINLKKNTILYLDQLDDLLSYFII